MLVPLQLTFRDVPLPRQAQIEERVRRRVAKLERFFDPINSCRVAIERPHQSERSGNPYRVRLDITVPQGHEVVVRKEPGDNDLHSDLLTVVNGAFEAAERQLVELVDRMRGDVKGREEPRAMVLRRFREQSMGKAGPQASTVQIVAGPGVAAAVAENAVEEPFGWEESAR